MAASYLQGAEDSTRDDVTSVESLRRQETMLPNKKMDSFRDDNQGDTFPSSEPHVVVACPTCETKFAVEGSLLASFEAPRFHCSRCDAVFELSSDSHKSRPSARQTNDRRWVLDEDTSTATSSRHNNAHNTPPVQSMVKPTDFSLGSASSDQVTPQPPFSIFPTSNDRPSLSLLGLNTPPARRESHTGSEQVDLTSQLRRTPPISVEEVSCSIASDPFSLFDDPTTLNATQNAANTTSPTMDWTVDAKAPAPPQNMLTEPTAHRAVKGRNVDAAGAETPKPSVARRRLVATSLSRLSIRTRSLAYLSAPVLGAMAMLVTIGYSSYLAPQALDVGLQAIIPTVITGPSSQLPPSELSVQDISLEFVKTQSREGLGVVHGVVYNGSSASLNDVRLEALGFDDRGQIVVRTQAPLRSALAREKVSDLSLATVKKFQSSLSASSSKIGVGERVAFSIALLDTTSGEGIPVNLSQVRYFSARVFSVSQ